MRKGPPSPFPPPRVSLAKNSYVLISRSVVNRLISLDITATAVVPKSENDTAPAEPVAATVKLPPRVLIGVIREYTLTVPAQRLLGIGDCEH